MLKERQKLSQSKFLFDFLNFPFHTFFLFCGQCHLFIQKMLLIACDIDGVVLGAEDMKIC